VVSTLDTPSPSRGKTAVEKLHNIIILVQNTMTILIDKKQIVFLRVANILDGISGWGK